MRSPAPSSPSGGAPAAAAGALIVAIAVIGCGPAPAAEPAPATAQRAQGLPQTCDEAAGAFTHWLGRHDRELGTADPHTSWFTSLNRLANRRCELDHWSATARACTLMGCFAIELSPWQQANLRAVVGFALTPGFQRKVARDPGDAPTQEPHEFARAAAAVGRMAACSPPRCALPDAACDAAVTRMVADLVYEPSQPDDRVRIRRTPTFAPSLHVLLYDQCASGRALSGHDIGAWSPGARTCFATQGIVQTCTDQLTEPQRDSGEFVIAPWFDALRAEGEP
jgi:hypothetical protein